MNAEVAAHGQELADLCRRFGVDTLELFGSAATEDERPGKSDLDFLVEFESSPPGGYSNAFFGLLESLEELFGRPVNLVAASTITNPYLREAVESTKVSLYPT